MATELRQNKKQSKTSRKKGLPDAGDGQFGVAFIHSLHPTDI
jgi:hypothetical protein